MTDKRHTTPSMLTTDTTQASDATLLGLVLQLRSSRNQAEQLGAQLLEQFGGIRPLLRVNTQILGNCRGIGPKRLAILRAIQELARRYYLAEVPTGTQINNPADTERYLSARLRDLPHEVFCCLYLDNRHRVLGFEELFRGTIDGTSVYPREVVKEALRYNAAALIVAHNHPSGVAEPSQADEQITRRLRAALELVDIRLLDHFVIGHTEAVSLAGRGLI